MTTECLDNFNGACETIDKVMYSLETFSRSFEAVGNRDVARSLNSLNRLLKIAKERIDKGSSQVVTEMINKSAENSDNILKASLAGASFALHTNGHKEQAKSVAKLIPETKA